MRLASLIYQRNRRQIVGSEKNPAKLCKGELNVFAVRMQFELRILRTRTQNAGAFARGSAGSPTPNPAATALMIGRQSPAARVVGTARTRNCRFLRCGMQPWRFGAHEVCMWARVRTQSLRVAAAERTAVEARGSRI